MRKMRHFRRKRPTKITDRPVTAIQRESCHIYHSHCLRSYHMNYLLEACSNNITCERVFHPHRSGQPLFTVQELSAFLKGACEGLKKQQCSTKALAITLESVLDERRGSTSQFTINTSLPAAAHEPEQLFLPFLLALTKLYSPNESYLKCRLDLIPEDSRFEAAQAPAHDRFSWQNDILAQRSQKVFSRREESLVCDPALSR